MSAATEISRRAAIICDYMGWSHDGAAWVDAERLACALEPKEAVGFQPRVRPWMLACFNEAIAADRLERNDRFIEEALELVQASDYSRERAHALVDYVFDRPQGDINQEVGGVMVTLAAHCLAHGVDMHEAGERELARINQPAVIEKIRAKQAAKPKGSALPVAPEQGEPMPPHPNRYPYPVPCALTAEEKGILLDAIINHCCPPAVYVMSNGDAFADIGKDYRVTDAWLQSVALNVVSQIAEARTVYAGDTPVYFQWEQIKANAREGAMPHHRRHPWAQPGDEPDRIFMLRFADPDMRTMVFTGDDAERQAHDAYRLYAPAWNVYLLATVAAGEIKAEAHP